MAKKVETVEVLENTAVHSSINMTLNQNDMIDLVVEEQLEVLEGRLETIDKDVQDTFDRIKEYNQKLSAKYDGRIRSSVGYKEFAAAVKAVKGTLESNPINIEIIRKDGYWSESTDKFKYKTGNLEQAEETKVPLASYKRSINNHQLAIRCGKEFAHEYRFHNDKKGLSITYDAKIKITTADYTACKEYVKKEGNKIASLYTTRHELALKYLEAKYGGKRIKAKITKQMLNGSAEGQSVLKVLNEVSSVNLLGDGKK